MRSEVQLECRGERFDRLTFARVRRNEWLDPQAVALQLLHYLLAHGVGFGDHDLCPVTLILCFEASHFAGRTPDLGSNSRWSGPPPGRRGPI